VFFGTTGQARTYPIGQVAGPSRATCVRCRARHAVAAEL